MGQGQDGRGRRLTTCLSAATLQQPGFSGFLFFFFFFIFFFFSSSFLRLRFFFFSSSFFVPSVSDLDFCFSLWILDGYSGSAASQSQRGGAFFLPSAVRPSSLSVRPSVRPWSSRTFFFAGGRSTGSGAESERGCRFWSEECFVLDEWRLAELAVAGKSAAETEASS